MKDKSEQLILVLDNDDYMRENIVVIFELEGYRVAAAADGVTGLAEARRLRPDLIVCDSAVPGIDAVAFLETLRADPETRSLRFVCLLRRVDRLDHARLTRLGVNTYLTKPFTPQELLEQAQIELNRQQSVD